MVVDVSEAASASCELAAQLRLDVAEPQLPIVTLIPPSQIDCVEQFRQMGIETCLLKPVTPAVLRDAVAEATGNRPSPRSQQEPGSMDETCRPLNLLVADDSPVNLEVAEGLLGLHGHTVDTVSNGREAIEALRLRDYDLILMDIEMPEMDGLEATSAIRKMVETDGTRTPIIAMTAHALNGFRDR